MMAGTILIAGSAEQAIHDSPIPVLRLLGVAETASDVTISGHVHTYYFKQLAQETILPLLNGRQLINQIVVDPQS